jgi:hypothetical protein
MQQEKEPNRKFYTLDPQKALDLQDPEKEIDLDKFTDDLLAQSPMAKDMGIEKARRLLKSMIGTESGGKDVTSQNGARGYGQIMPILAKEYTP